MTPEPALVYMTPGHREALAGLAYAILERKGFAMLTGEAGTGKSTLLARMLHCLPANRVVSSVILNPTLTEAEFLELALLDFGFARRFRSARPSGWCNCRNFCCAPGRRGRLRCW